MMRHLPLTPRSFGELVLADLLRAQRLKIRIEDEIDPQFRIASPEGPRGKFPALKIGYE